MRATLHLAALCVVATFLLAVPAIAGDNTVTIPLADWLNPILEFVGVIAAGLATWLVALLVKFLPSWLQPIATTAVQTALAGWIRQAINYAIQQVEGFDKGKVITFEAGNSALAVALRFLIDHAPGWLLQLAGGPDKLKAQILAQLSDHGIVLDTGVDPTAVAVAADSHPAIVAIGGDAGLKKLLTGK